MGYDYDESDDIAYWLGAVALIIAASIGFAALYVL